VAAAAIENNVAIHAVTVGAPGDALKTLCGQTGGWTTSIDEPAAAVDALAKLYSALSNCYRIRYSWETESDAGEAIVRIEVHGAGGHGSRSSNRSDPAAR
jgi:hypothetical protein